MKKLRVLLSVGLLAAILPAITSTVYANPKFPLVIREINITGNEFVVLQATENISDMADYWLSYVSDDTAGNLVPSAQLPPQKLKAGQAIILTSDGAETCDAIYTVKLPFSLSNAAGTLEVRKLSIINNTTATFTTTDSVHWRKPTSTHPISGTDKIDLSQESGSNPVWYHDPTDLSADWKVGDFGGCTLAFPKSVISGSTPAVINWPQTDVYPPATILSSSTTSAGKGPGIPAHDIGLKAPILNEILPNPAKPQTDSDDEFIELYNPNSTSFDLSGFVLETGSTTSSRRHVYTFPGGTELPPKSFKAFKSSQTSLNLSNSGGQVWLLDPFSKVISKSDAYGEAKDGLAWALANGKWYWTTLPTFGKANVIEEPTGSSSSSSKKATVKGKPVTALKGDSTSAGSTDSNDDQGSVNSTPVHPWILAVVAALALLYGAYEYRHDLANRVYQFRKYLEARRGTRK
jgi:hypothetical protein